MKSLKQLYKEWKEKREFKSFIEQIEPGFNYFENKYNPKNRIEVYKSDKNEYITKDYLFSRLIKEYHAANKDEFSDYILKNNFHNYLERVNHFDMSDIYKDEYNDKVNKSFNDIQENIKSVRESIDELKKQFQENNSLNTDSPKKDKGLEK